MACLKTVDFIIVRVLNCNFAEDKLAGFFTDKKKKKTVARQLAVRNAIRSENKQPFQDCCSSYAICKGYFFALSKDNLVNLISL